MIQANERIKCETRIFDKKQLCLFINGKAHSDIIEFIELLSESIHGKSLILQSEYEFENSSKEDSNVAAILTLLNLLTRLDLLIDEIPPIKQPMRFGNKAFQTWYDRTKQVSISYLTELLNQKFDYLEEVQIYFVESFGNRNRVDYGTGHELNFILFLFCINKLGIIQNNYLSELVMVIFYRYILLMRKLQSVYLLEPAGSRGVWGLDDYHFLPFVFGSSQFIDSEDKFPILPSQVLDQTILNTCSDKLLYLNSIKHILNVKTNVYFAECSPVLYSLTSIPSWRKIYTGMIKMYIAEILDKFPIAQHIVFGNIIKFN
ncbi:phosphotyrosyl phosphatase activator protein-related [Cryptosporidium ryanae]|uniref:phosphotyrosyl phosphatase activator protein-related n=1 Tax=Cryptosporidium ryanae TaxID=515981 RepID=UPI00351A2772|nr:phosphotyrosyl phosphatase activator protein-related [Cryptosporidium ryanae]